MQEGKTNTNRMLTRNVHKYIITTLHSQRSTFHILLLACACFLPLLQQGISCGPMYPLYRAINEVPQHIFNNKIKKIHSEKQTRVENGKFT